MKIARVDQLFNDSLIGFSIFSVSYLNEEKKSPENFLALFSKKCFSSLRGKILNFLDQSKNTFRANQIKF